MTLDEALAFRLPSGTPIGNATPADFLAAAEFYSGKLRHTEKPEPAKMTEAERKALRASLDRCRELTEAMAIINAHLPLR
jgi:hypothetical protein